MAFQFYNYGFVFEYVYLVLKILGFALLILAIIFFFSKDGDTEEQKEKRVISKEDVLKLLGVLAFILVYITILEVVGFVIMTFLFIIISSRFLGYKNWKVLML